jgi:pimeloyl-ACP methyl ester carboxylesterase/DNA-binding SARP family transcriptional activator
VSSLSIRLLGGLSVERDGKQVALPQSKKTRALLGYLVATGRSHQRARLCELLWDVADDPRAGLRWSLSKLRKIVNDDEQRIVSDGESITFEGAGAYVDLYALRDAASSSVDPDTVDALVLPGELLAGLELADFHAFQAWCIAERGEARRLQATTLQAMLDHVGDDHERALPYVRHAAIKDPTSPDAHNRLLRVLDATRREREAEQHLRIARSALKEAGVDPSSVTRAKSAVVAKDAAAPSDLSQVVRFCSAADGTHIAWAKSGKGPPILKAANWLSHLEHDWESPVWGHTLRFLSERNELCRYDIRGCGLSHCDLGEDLGLEQFVMDLEAVADASGHQRFTLLGISFGAAICIEYAARHPERVAGMILYGGFAKGWAVRASDSGLERDQAIQTLIRTGWSSDNPAFRQIFTSHFIPSASLEQINFFNELQRVSATAENAARLRKATGLADVSARLADIHIPTLVMHATDDQVALYGFGREMAMSIPDARFVTLEGENHILLEGDPGWHRFTVEIRNFLDELALVSEV